MNGERVGAGTASTPGVRLVRRPFVAPPPRIWGAAERALLDDESAARPGWVPWQVLGGPGTGKTTLITDLAVRRIARRGETDSVLVLTQSRRASDRVRADVTAGLLAAGLGRSATREPTVRTIHSYAFSVLRLQASACGNPPPRLLTGVEQDAVVREMLRGDLTDMAAGAAAYWPERLHPALPMGGFATELRELMLRATERGLGPEDLIRLGRRHSRPEWVAAGTFATSYEQATLLRWSVGVEAPGATAPALDAAELVGAALTALATDDDLLHAERTRTRTLLVDDAQHLDPQAAALVRLIGEGTDLTVVAGDPDQSIFGFRGADSRFLTELGGGGADWRRVVLRTDHRAAARPARLVAGIAAALPGLPIHRGLAVPADDVPAGTATVRVLSTVAKEASYIADEFRRAHLIDGVPWSSMVVIVRSVPLAVAPLRRALSAAGVPIGSAVSELPLALRRGAQWLLLILRALTAPRQFTGDEATALLTGPVGGADPVAMRRLRRGLRRGELAAGGERDSAELLRLALLTDADVTDLVDGLTEVEAAPLGRVRDVLAGAAVAVRSRGGVEDVLWAAWQASGLERRWATASLRGGAVGAQADRDLDAAVALFEAAAAYVDRLPRASIPGFIEYVEQQQISVDSSARLVAGEAVGILSPHAAAGREWDVVAVAGVQDGIWPNLRPRSSLLHTEELVDLVAGVAEPGKPVSRTAPLLADERRLLLVACSRARRTLLVTAVESTSGDRDLIPSRFIEELAARADDGTDDIVRPARSTGRVLALSALVGELRAVVCDPDIAAAQPDRHRRAVTQLARLAGAGVRGADPDRWYGLRGVSVEAPLWNPADGPVPLSPSMVELLSTCPLRWALERNGGSDGDTTRAVAGTVVHALVQAMASGVPRDLLDRELENIWDGIDLGSDWYSRRELRRTRSMLDNFAAWLRSSRGELTQAGVEVSVEWELPPRGEGDPSVRVRGRVDRLERDADGRLVIVDVKTGKSPVTKEDAQQHAQLATYQAAVAEGGVVGEPAADPGGARLVYVANPNTKDGAAQRTQSPLDPDAVERWRDTIHDAAASTRGPGYRAVVSDSCRHCPVIGSCPAHDQGRQVTEE